MGVWKNKDGKTVRRETIPKGSQWTWWTIEMMGSPAYRALSLSAHRVITRIRVELANHAGKDNGKLPVTFLDFEKYGVHRHAIAPAIREAEALGWIHVTQYGRAGTGDYRAPNMFALTHMTVNEMKATNNWDKIETMVEAQIIAKAARKTPNTSAGKRTSTSAGKRTSKGKSPHPKTALQDPAETAPLSIYREGTDRSSEPALSSLPPWVLDPQPVQGWSSVEFLIDDHPRSRHLELERLAA
jgi:hypothetical protein